MDRLVPGTDSVAPLLKVLKNKALVWVQQAGMQRVVIAQADKHNSVTIHGDLPVSVLAEKRPLRGRRIRTNGPRSDGNRSFRAAAWPKDGVQARRTATLTCVLNGQADIQVGNYLLHCSEGTFLFLLAGTPHDDGSRSHLVGEQKNSRHCAVLWIVPNMTNKGLGCWICHSQGEAHYERPMESCFLVDKQTRAIYDVLFEEVMLGRSRYQDACGSLLVALLISMIEEMEMGNFLQVSYQMEADDGQFKDEDPIRVAQEYIKSHLHKHLTINDVAQHLHISRTQFTRLFREKTGSSFTEYLTLCRLEEAKILLAATHWSVEKICGNVGVTPSRLRAIFQSYLQVSPSEYRLQEYEKQKKRQPDEATISRSKRLLANPDDVQLQAMRTIS